MIRKICDKIIENIYLSRALLIIIFMSSGLVSTYIKISEVNMYLSAISVLGLVMGSGTVLISLLEAKEHLRPLVVVLDLLLLVVVFASIFCSIYIYDNAAFDISVKGIVYLDFLYFSFITLTTTGYGEIVPVSYLAKFLSAAESFMFACIISVAIVNFTHTINNRE